jgi:alpha-galactosidase
MVEDYGADYIKLDFNQDAGVGTDYLAFCAGEGLEQCANAYLKWIDGIRKRFPNVLFETCSSGGMRMDYRTLSNFSIVSTSDQTDYSKYPYVAGNILSAVLPEQAAVWSYPVDNKEKLPSDEQVVMNMINSFLGRMHLASNLSLLTERQFALVREGVSYYKSVSEAKKTALPYFPNGFTRYGEDFVCAGFETKDRIYLAVWNLGQELHREIKLGAGVSAECAYPKDNTVDFRLEDGLLSVDFTEQFQARFFEILK